MDLGVGAGATGSPRSRTTALRSALVAVLAAAWLAIPALPARAATVTCSNNSTTFTVSVPTFDSGEGGADTWPYLTFTAPSGNLTLSIANYISADITGCPTAASPFSLGTRNIVVDGTTGQNYANVVDAQLLTGRTMTFNFGQSGATEQGDVIILSGSSGNDTMNFSSTVVRDTPASELRIQGMGGGDLITGTSGPDVINGGPGGDTMDGAGGADTLSYIGATGGVTATLNGAGTAGEASGDTSSNFEDLFGSAYRDFLYGTSGVDVIHGGNGDDAIYGKRGNDSLYGDSGIDFLSGGGGNDTLYGGTGDDTLDGGGGADTLYGEGDMDTLLYGGGVDTLDGGTEADSCEGYAGSTSGTGKYGRVSYAACE